MKSGRSEVELHRYIWLGLMASGVGYALWRGAWPERAYAVMLVVASYATRLTQDLSHLADPQYGILVVDVVFLGLCIALALRSDRWWLLFASAFQLLDVVTHAGMILDVSLAARPYMVGLAIWGYGLLLALVAGTWLIDQERRPQRPRPNSLSRRQ